MVNVSSGAFSTRNWMLLPLVVWRSQRMNLKMCDFVVVGFSSRESHELSIHFVKLTHRCHCWSYISVCIGLVSFRCAHFIRFCFESTFVWLCECVCVCLGVWFCFELICFRMNDEEPASSWLITTTQKAKKSNKTKQKSWNAITYKHGGWKEKRKEMKSNRRTDLHTHTHAKCELKRAKKNKQTKPNEKK